MKVPPTLSTGEIARACEIDRRKVVRELRAANLLDRPGRYYRVSSSRLRERLPDHYDRVYSWFMLEGRPSKAIGNHRQPGRAIAER